MRSRAIIFTTTWIRAINRFIPRNQNNLKWVCKIGGFIVHHFKSVKSIWFQASCLFESWDLNWIILPTGSTSAYNTPHTVSLSLPRVSESPSHEFIKKTRNLFYWNQVLHFIIHLIAFPLGKGAVEAYLTTLATFTHSATSLRRHFLSYYSIHQR